MMSAFMGKAISVFFVLLCIVADSASGSNYAQMPQPVNGPPGGEKTYTLVTYAVEDQYGQQRQVQKLINLPPGASLTGQCQVQQMGQTSGGVGVVGVIGSGQTVSTSVRTERRCYRVQHNPDGSIGSKTPVPCPQALGPVNSGQQYPPRQVGGVQSSGPIQQGQSMLPQQSQGLAPPQQYAFGGESQRSAGGLKSPELLPSGRNALFTPPPPTRPTRPLLLQQAYKSRGNHENQGDHDGQEGDQGHGGHKGHDGHGGHDGHDEQGGDDEFGGPEGSFDGPMAQAPPLGSDVETFENGVLIDDEALKELAVVNQTQLQPSDSAQL